MTDNTYLPGTRLVCIACNALIATLKVERKSRDTMMRVDFDFPGEEPKSGTPIRCPACAGIRWRIEPPVDVDNTNTNGDTTAS